MRRARLPMPQGKRWQLPTSPRILLALQFMPYRRSIGPPAPRMPMQPSPKNELGNTNTCLNWEKPGRVDLRNMAAHTPAQSIINGEDF